MNDSTPDSVFETPPNIDEYAEFTRILFPVPPTITPKSEIAVFPVPPDIVENAPVAELVPPFLS